MTGTRLYKRRVDGNVQQTLVELDLVEGTHRTVTRVLSKDENFEITGEYRIGKPTTSEWTQCEPKNWGKKNQTTRSDQAGKEYDSKIQHMLDNGYVEDIKDVDNPSIKKVAMLAKAYDPDRVTKEIKKTGHVFVQPKLDGIRCIATRQGLFSRSGKRFVSLPHIEEELKLVFDVNPNLILDGEIYNHDLRDQFDKIASIVMKSKVEDIDFEEAKKAQYHIYDCVSDSSFSDRVKMTPVLYFCLHLRNVEEVKVENATSLEKHFTMFEKQGYEGSMVRYNAPYQRNKRNWNLQKVKKFVDDEFEIVAINNGKGKEESLACTISVLADGVVSHPKLMGTDQFRAEVWQNKEEYIGGVATVKYFEKTKDGALRFPNAKMVFKANEGRTV